MKKGYILGSINNCIKCKNELAMQDIYSEIAKSSKNKGQKGCAYSLVISEKDEIHAKIIIQQNKVKIIGEYTV